MNIKRYSGPMLAIIAFTVVFTASSKTQSNNNVLNAGTTLAMQSSSVSWLD